MIEVLNHQEQVKFFVTLWAIWHARRKAIHDREFQSPLSTKIFIDRFVSDLDQCPAEPRANNIVAVEEQVSWIPPPVGHTSIHVDAAIGKSMEKAAIASVARSDVDSYLGESAVVYSGHYD